MANEPTNKELLIQLTNKVEQNQRTLRGYDGTPGLCTIVSNLEQKMDNIDTAVKENRAETKEQMKGLKEAIMTELQAQNELVNEKLNQRVGFKDILKDWITPIILAVLTALIVSHVVQ